MKSYSSIVGWLLLIATLVFDGVVVSWYAEMGPMSRVAVLYDALVASQLAVVCLWAVFAAMHVSMAWIGPLVAVSIAGALTARLADLSFAEACGIHGLYVALLTLALWVVKRTAFWRRLADSDHSSNWQYSLRHLLATMTILAGLIVALRGSTLFADIGGTWKFLAVMTLGDVVLVIGTLFVWVWSWWLPHWLPRLGAVCMPAFIVGIVETLLAVSGALGREVKDIQSRTKFDLIAYTLVVTAVIYIWLELVPIIPRARRAASLPPAEADTSSRERGA